MWLSHQNNLTNPALSQLNTSLNHYIPCHLQSVTKYVKLSVTIISCDRVFHHQPENVHRLVRFYIPLHQALSVRLLRVLQNHGQLWQIVVSWVFSIGKNWANYSTKVRLNLGRFQEYSPSFIKRGVRGRFLIIYLNIEHSYQR